MTPAEVQHMAHGIEPLMRPLQPGFNSGVLAMIVLTFILSAVAWRYVRGVWRQFFNSLAARRRTDRFDSGERTNSERWGLAVMLLQGFVCEALLIFAWLYAKGGIPPGSHRFFADVVALTLLCAAVFAVQWMGTGLTALAFAPRPAADSSEALRALTAAQSLTGPLLLIPALGALFYPVAVTLLVYCGLAIYVVLRIMFEAKVFRIFYSGPTSLFHFFLYLCILEMLPLAALLTAVMMLLGSYLV